MRKTNNYSRSVSFDAQAIDKVLGAFKARLAEPAKLKFTVLTVHHLSSDWNFDRYEEFIAAINGGFELAILSVYDIPAEKSLYMNLYGSGTFSPSFVTTVSPERDDIITILDVSDIEANRCLAPSPLQPPAPKPKIFIGHGGAAQWRDLKDHLHDHHGYDIIAYETGERAGHAIRDVIETMLNESALAILVMTAEDEQPDGTYRARQNVIHEIGLFQGRLGFEKAIVLKEDGTEEFSNIHGVQQIRYAKGNIKETFGGVLAWLRRVQGEADR